MDGERILKIILEKLAINMLDIEAAKDLLNIFLFDLILIKLILIWYDSN